MITICSAEGVTEPTLVGIAAMVTTENGVYSLSCSEPLLDRSTPLAGGLFGAIAWPRSRFRIAPGITLEQQLLLPHEGSAAGFAWQLSVNPTSSVHLEVRPFFAGCDSRSYRDFGFRFQSAEEGGRLTWLPGVLGPTIIADTNGIYQRNACLENYRSRSDYLVAPGAFEFELGVRPSVLILTNDRTNATSSEKLVGSFLAALMPLPVQPYGLSESTINVMDASLAA